MKVDFGKNIALGFGVVVVFFVIVRLCEKMNKRKRKKNKFARAIFKIVAPKCGAEKTCYFWVKVSCLPPLIRRPCGDSGLHVYLLDR